MNYYNEGFKALPVIREATNGRGQVLLLINLAAAKLPGFEPLSRDAAMELSDKDLQKHLHALLLETAWREMAIREICRMADYLRLPDAPPVAARYEGMPTEDLYEVSYRLRAAVINRGTPDGTPDVTADELGQRDEANEEYP